MALQPMSAVCHGQVVLLGTSNALYWETLGILSSILWSELLSIAAFHVSSLGSLSQDRLRNPGLTPSHTDTSLTARLSG